MKVQPAGRAWVFGDNIDTDAMAPSAYLMQAPEVGVSHCMESIDAQFAGKAREGDIFVAGANLGLGSSRENAPFNLQQLGIRAVLAKSFARIFYRNTINLGLLALVCPQAHHISNGDRLSLDPLAGKVHNHSNNEILRCEPLPEHLLQIIHDGGLLQHLKRSKGTLPVNGTTKL